MQKNVAIKVFSVLVKIQANYLYVVVYTYNNVTESYISSVWDIRTKHIPGQYLHERNISLDLIFIASNL